MKKIKLYLYVLLTSLTMFSCRDAIDIVQDGEINNEVAFQKVADLRSFLNGTVYGSIDTSNEMLLGSFLLMKLVLLQVIQDGIFLSTDIF